jgi:succinyl-diaminopimelate desuccinylase
MDYVQTLKDLVSMDTTVPPGKNYEKIMDYLTPLFKNAGCDVQKIAIPKEAAHGAEGRFNLLAHRRNPGKPRLILYTHADVVPVAGWDGFTPKIENGKFYGRGAGDDKGNIVAMLMALERMKGQALKYDTSCIVSVDEEVGHADADEIRFIRQYLEPVKDAYFLALDSSFGIVGVATLGLLAMEITVHGKSVHQGRAYLGENAVENALKLCQPLMKLGEEVIKRKSRIPASPETGVAKMQGNLCITMLHGGVKVNIVPDECVITIARRIIPEENIDVCEQEIRTVLATVPNVRYDAKVTERHPTVRDTYDEPIADELVKIIRDVAGEAGKYGAMGTLPVDPVSVEWGAKIIATGVGRSAESNAHGKDEMIYLKDLEALAEIVTRFMKA